ncbi:uncharacterized [Tachysurus ichikawai]
MSSCQRYAFSVESRPYTQLLKGPGGFDDPCHPAASRGIPLIIEADLRRNKRRAVKFTVSRNRAGFNMREARSPTDAAACCGLPLIRGHPKTNRAILQPTNPNCH